MCVCTTVNSHKIILCWSSPFSISAAVRLNDRHWALRLVLFQINCQFGYGLNCSGRQLMLLNTKHNLFLFFLENLMWKFELLQLRKCGHIMQKSNSVLASVYDISILQFIFNGCVHLFHSILPSCFPLFSEIFSSLHPSNSFPSVSSAHLFYFIGRPIF